MRIKLLLTIMMLATSAHSQSPDVCFRAAKQKETVEGDLRSAIRMYQELAESKDSSRDLAAQALLRLGECYEKLGSTESKRAYERVLRQYADGTQIASVARQRLAALAHARLWPPASTRARLSQILQLNYLAPEIQEQLLFLPPTQANWRLLATSHHGCKHLVPKLHLYRDSYFDRFGYLDS